ncbi:hypothetical protein F751_2302 [Auxenochlorella protothecoides]|uniref:Uncharacterized protein n=1 Tax=Auxenochlorella protothecoides TaxID=3075 RepID=A0A087SFT0_AUXPR|nr:hypothetical protein F751_2302 [Auxenochlorella protothecoides]KFM24584.1 hypothetical protein F751_2302 [Auxenochlorella protothecoides]
MIMGALEADHPPAMQPMSSHFSAAPSPKAHPRLQLWRQRPWGSNRRPLSTAPSRQRRAYRRPSPSRALCVRAGQVSEQYKTPPFLEGRGSRTRGR